jgi:hypothetical protein
MLSVFIYYDYLDPQSCEMREYLFPTSEMAESFRLDAVKIHEMVFVSPIFHNYHLSIEEHHTCFSSVEEATHDLTMFVDREKRSQYKHHDNIFIVPMDHLRFLIYRSECVYLEEENKMLRSQLEKYKQQTKEEERKNIS